MYKTHFVKPTFFVCLYGKVVLSNMNIQKEEFNNVEETTLTDFHGSISEVLWLLMHILSIWKYWLYHNPDYRWCKSGRAWKRFSHAKGNHIENVAIPHLDNGMDNLNNLPGAIILFKVVVLEFIMLRSCQLLTFVFQYPSYWEWNQY